MIFGTKKQKKGGFLNSIREMVWLLFVVFIIRTFGFGLYQVPTGSMETTMLVGERFFADKFTILFSPPQRSQVIAFNDPVYPYSTNFVKRLFQEYVWGPSNWTKRVIGIPGDKVKGVIEDGKPVVYLNDKKLDEPYLNQYPLLALWPEEKDAIAVQAEQEACLLARQGRIKESDIEFYINESLFRCLLWRPYVAQYPFSEQPYYRINEQNIVRVPETEKIEIPGIAIEQGMLLRKPHTPRPMTDGSLGNFKNDGNYWDGSDEFYVELGPNQYWLMGDNRRGSSDCRVFGPINKRLIHGKILFRIWSSDSTESWWIVDLIKHPIDFWQRMRWRRFFQLIH